MSLKESKLGVCLSKQFNYSCCTDLQELLSLELSFRTVPPNISRSLHTGDIPSVRLCLPAKSSALLQESTIQAPLMSINIDVPIDYVRTRVEVFTPLEYRSLWKAFFSRLSKISVYFPFHFLFISDANLLMLSRWCCLSHTMESEVISLSLHFVKYLSHWRMFQIKFADQIFILCHVRILVRQSIFDAIENIHFEFSATYKSC